MVGPREMGNAGKIPTPFPRFPTHSGAILNKEVEQVTQVPTT